MSRAFVGRIERISLTDSDNVEIRDAIGNVLEMAPNGARSLHRELGKFLSASNDAKPLPAPTRADFRNLTKRVEAIEKQIANGDPS